MKTVNLIQGSPEWHAHRREHFNASETAAMLGLDPKTSRTDLLRMKATGHEKEFSEWVQKNVLDYGHEVEAAARPIIEKMVGEELYPVTGTEGRLSASFDGLTMMEDTAFEHKQWNEELANLVRQGEVPDTHMPQLQQQLMVSDADKVIFVVSDGTPEKMVWTEVEPDSSWFERIMQGWTQFAKDLQEYEHREIKEKPVADVIQELPSLFVEITGEVKNTNLPMVRDAATAFIAAIKTDLKTDEDFSNAEATVKFCDKAEKQLDATKAAALAQTQSIDEVMKTIDFIKEELRSKRLMLNKLVKERKEEIKREILTDAQSKFSTHVIQLNAGIAPCSIPAINPDFIGSMKNKRTLKSLYDAVDAELANAKIEANKAATLIGDNLEHYHQAATGYEFLFNDLNHIIQSPLEAFDAIIKARISEHKQAEEQRIAKERERIRAEEEEKAKLQTQIEAEQHAFGDKQADKVQQKEQQTQVQQAVKKDGTKLERWAQRHGVSDQAMQELYAILNQGANAA